MKFKSVLFPSTGRREVSNANWRSVISASCSNGTTDFADARATYAADNASINATGAAARDGVAFASTVANATVANATVASATVASRNNTRGAWV